MFSKPCPAHLNRGITTTTAVTLVAVIAMTIATIWCWQQLRQSHKQFGMLNNLPVNRIFQQTELKLYQAENTLLRQAASNADSNSALAALSLAQLDLGRKSLDSNSPFLGEFLQDSERATAAMVRVRDFFAHAKDTIRADASPLELTELAYEAGREAVKISEIGYAARAFDSAKGLQLNLQILSESRHLAFLGLIFLIGIVVAMYLTARNRGLLKRTRAQLISETIAASQAEELFNEAVATAPDGYIVFDRDDRIVMRNAAVDRVYGQLAEAIELGRSYLDVIEFGIKNRLFRDLGDSAQETRDFISRRIRDHSAEQSELLFRTNDERWVRVVNRRSRSGYIVSAATDLTRMKFTEQALRESEAQYRGILQDHSDFIVRFNSNLDITYLNPAYAKHLGKDQRELIHANLSEVLPASAVGDIEMAMGRVTPDNPSVSRDLLVRGPGGLDRWENWTIRAFYDEDQLPTAYQALGRDISKEKVATDALVSSARLFRSIAEAHPIPVLLSRVSDYEIVYANEASFPLLGSDLEAVSSRTANEYFADKATLDRFTELMQTNRAVTDFPARVRCVDGRVFQAQVNARVARYADETVLAVSIVDMTERNDALEQLNNHRMALARSEKLSALGSLLASVSHELNNPLAIVVGQSQLLEAAARDADVRDRATKISRAAKRSARIVKTFLSMVRQRPPTRTAVSLNETIEKSMEIAEFGLKSGGIELRLELDPTIPRIQADEDQLVQVAVNLIINASQALQELSDDDDKEIIVSTSQPDAQMVRLSVADSGRGIAPGIRDKIFDPFFTTKDVGVGTGIGLSVTSNIVRSHAGKIQVTKSERGGAQISDILKLDGYQTELVNNGELALSRLASRQYDLVITDLRMPGIDGPTLYREILRQTSHRADRIVFTTGDALNENAQEFLEDSSHSAIEKPFQPNEIRALVRRLLTKDTSQET